MKFKRNGDASWLMFPVCILGITGLFVGLAAVSDSPEQMQMKSNRAIKAELINRLPKDLTPEQAVQTAREITNALESKDCPNCKRLEEANEELLHQYRALKAEWDRSRNLAELPEADGGE